jgi:transcriptional regulator with XRE-family HTH domain
MKEVIDMRFSRLKLIEARKDIGKNLEEVARAVSKNKYWVSRATLYNWERGITKPSVTDLERLADLYKKEIWYFFGHENKQTV